MLNKRIVFKGTISSLYIYSEILNQLAEYYHHNSDRDSTPIFDLKEVDYIEPSALPLIISLGEYLCKFHKKSINILLLKGSKIANFLWQTGFLRISEEKQIFNHDKDILDEFSFKPLRDIHKMEYTGLMRDYIDLISIPDIVQKRAYIWDNLSVYDKCKHMKVLSDTNNLSEAAIDITLMAITELKTNAIMHSEDRSYMYVASNKFATHVSIADCGIGFEKSLEKVEKHLEMVKKFENSKNIGLHNFFVIMDVLNYSFKKNGLDSRWDLWTLRNEIVRSYNFTGSFKIHYINTQVIFTTNRCGKCDKFIKQNKDISVCVKCLLNDFSNTLFSPIKIFDVGFKGVHIEFTISRG